MAKQRVNEQISEVLSDSQQELAERQMTSDLAGRSLPGTFMYVAAWFFLYYVISVQTERASTLDWLNVFSVVVVFGSLIRIFLVIIARKTIAQTVLSRALLAFGVLISSITWGVMAACASLDTPLAPFGQVILLTTAGLSAGGAVTFSASRSFVGLFLCGMLLPTIMVELLVVDEADLEVLFAVGLYLFGMYVVTAHPYREYISALISNIRLSELSKTDGLTGLKNRRAFDESLKEELCRAQRMHYPLSLVLLDIDHFKRINDEYGHPAGDYCLQQLAVCMQKSVGRVSDTLARYGGEEFAVILPDTATADAFHVAEQIRQAVLLQDVVFEGVHIPLTVSAGVCTGERTDKSVGAEKLLALADKALYAAKNGGRNRVEHALFRDQQEMQVTPAL